jgi:hypothetical protein
MFPFKIKWALPLPIAWGFFALGVLAMLGSLFLCLSVAHAQFVPMPGQAAVPVTSAGFVGPGDLQTFANFWSFGCLKNGYTGKAFRLIRTGDNTTIDMSCDATTGLATVSSGSAPATFCSGVTCGLSILYDQAGTCDLTSFHSAIAVNTDSVNIPPSGSNLLGGQETVNMGSVIGTSDHLTTTCTPGVSMPYTVYIVANRRAGTGYQLVLNINSSAGAWVGFNNSASNAAIASATVVIKAATDTAWHTIIGTVAANGAATLTVDGGTAASGSVTGTIVAPTQYCLGESCALSLMFDGRFVEAGIISGVALGSTDIGALNANIRAAGRWNF